MEDTHETPSTERAPVSNSVLTGLAMLGGAGILAVTVALGIGVIAPNIDSDLIGLIIALGIGMLALSIGGWVFATQPFRNFDDINVPQYHGHHHEEHDEPVTSPTTVIEDDDADTVTEPSTVID